MEKTCSDCGYKFDVKERVCPKCGRLVIHNAHDRLDLLKLQKTQSDQVVKIKQVFEGHEILMEQESQRLDKSKAHSIPSQEPARLDKTKPQSIPSELLEKQTEFLDQIRLTKPTPPQKNLIIIQGRVVDDSQMGITEFDGKPITVSLQDTQLVSIKQEKVDESGYYSIRLGKGDLESLQNRKTKRCTLIVSDTSGKSIDDLGPIQLELSTIPLGSSIVVNLATRKDSESQFPSMDPHYLIYTDEYGRSTIRFGDAANGIRLPSGQEIRASYQIDSDTTISFEIGSYEKLLKKLTSHIDMIDDFNSWTYRGSDDPGIALMESTSIICDLLTFYQEVYANQALLRTTEWRESITRLLESTGYLISVTRALYSAIKTSTVREKLVEVSSSPSIQQLEGDLVNLLRIINLGLIICSECGTFNLIGLSECHNCGTALS